METLTREELIARLRDHLVSLTDEDHSICQVAAERGIFCRGFARLSSTELREKYRWLEEKAHRRLTTDELRERANVWELARQQVTNTPIACDAEQHDRDQCTGWDGLSNPQLAHFLHELTGDEVEVTAED